MPLERYLIAPEEVGLETDLRPWLIPDTAYEQLNNAYVYRGRIRKRFGSQYMVPSVTPSQGYEQLASRLRVKLGVGPGAYNIPNSSVANPLLIGQVFSVGDNIFTINQVGAGVPTLSTNPAMSATIDTTLSPNTVTFVGVPAVNAYWYPGYPVMGLPIWQTQTINNEPTIAFDTRYAYQYGPTGWERLDGEVDVGAATWQGSDSDFFWAYTYQGRNVNENFLFVTNFNPLENNFMRFLDGSFQWNNFRPCYATTNGTLAGATGFIISARIIVGFHNHLVLLNTWESDTVLGTKNYKNRARYAAIGTPLDTFNAAPASAYLPWVDNKNSAWFRGGGYADNLQTQEQIVSAEFIKDRLVVYYERSTWELAYTGNEQIPFIWQQINTEFGAQSTFSKVPFDTHTLAIAQNGITACTGANVARIDEKIPQEVFKIRNDNNGVLRVQGIRDYKPEMVYWTMPLNSWGSQFANVFPNQVLTYNYRTKSWAYNTDSFTAFGYFTQTVAATWGNTFKEWQFMTALWSDGSLQANDRKIIAGNQEGYVLYINPDFTRNAGALQITDATAAGSVITLTIIDHNLIDVDINTQQDEYILIENIAGAQGVAFWTSLNGGIFPIQEIVDKDTIKIAAFPIADPNPYKGGGTVARVSNINILSKQWNPYNKSGQNVFIQKINFLVDRTSEGQVQVDYYPSTSKLSTLQTAVPGQLFSNGILSTAPYNPIFYPSEQYQDRLWHVQYLACDGTAIQIRITMNDAQMVQPNISLVDFQLHGLILEAMPTSSRIGG